MEVNLSKPYLRIRLDHENILHKHFSQLNKCNLIPSDTRIRIDCGHDMLTILSRALRIISNLTRTTFWIKLVQKKSPVCRRALIDLANEDLLGISSHTLARSLFLTQGFCNAR